MQDFSSLANLQTNKTKLQKNTGNKKRSGILAFLTTATGILLLIVLIETVLLGLIFLSTPNILGNMWQQFQNTLVMGEVSRLTKLDTAKNPVIALVADADKLRADNAAQAIVYKDAMNGDYVVGFDDKLLIYRRGEGKIIYEGDNPTALLEKAQKTLVDNIKAKAKEKGLVSTDESPQLSVVTNPDQVLKNSGEFYRGASKDDVIAYFSTDQVIILYRPSTNAIINSGKYSVNVR